MCMNNRLQYIELLILFFYEKLLNQVLLSDTHKIFARGIQFKSDFKKENKKGGYHFSKY